MGGVSLPHLLILALILLIFFGPSRLPALGQSLGKAIKGFKEGLNKDEEASIDKPLLTENKDIVKQNTEHKS
jgi:sec-independent protein translocase protein TatA